MRESRQRLIGSEGGSRRSRTARGGVCALLVGGALALPLGLGSAGADSLGRSFVAVGESSGGYVRYGIPGFLVVDYFIDGGGPVSRASLGSDGTSQAFGSLPYPGSAGASYNGTVAFATGTAPPAYPFYASAFYPTQPEQKVEDPSGAYKLSAVVTGQRADGQAVVAAPPQGDHPVFRAAATSRGVAEDEQVRAEATSLTEGFVLGPVSIGSVRSESVTRYRKDDAAPVTTTAFQLDGGKAGDMTFSFGPAGLQVAKQGIPIPVPSGLSALNQALAPAGMSVRFVEPKPVPGGAAATAFEVVWTAKVPGAGDGIFLVRLGGASSFIQLAATEEEAVAEPAAAGPGPGSTDASTGPASGPAAASTTLGSTTAAEPALAPDAAPTSTPLAATSSTSVKDPVGHETATQPRPPSPTEPEALESTPPQGIGGSGTPTGRPEVAVRTVSERTASGSASGLSAVLLVGALAGCALVGGVAVAGRQRSWTA